MNKITIKFGIKLKPTKQIVVNYNFIDNSGFSGVVTLKSPGGVFAM